MNRAKAPDLSKFSNIMSIYSKEIQDEFDLDKSWFQRGSGLRILPTGIGDKVISAIFGRSKVIRNIQFQGIDGNEEKKYNIRVDRPLIPGETVFAPIISLVSEHPNPLTSSKRSYKKKSIVENQFFVGWDCEPGTSAEQCKYYLEYNNLNIKSSAKDFTINESPIVGFVELNIWRKSKGGKGKCFEKNYYKQNKNEKCSIELDSRFPGKSTIIELRVLNPPKSSMKYHFVSVELQGHRNFDITINNKEFTKICWGNQQACDKYYTNKDAVVITGTTKRSFGKWSKRATIKITNKIDKKPLGSRGVYKMKAEIKQAGLWRKNNGWSNNIKDTDDYIRELIFVAPETQKIKLTATFKPYNGMVGDDVFVDIKTDVQQSFDYAGIGSLVSRAKGAVATAAANEYKHKWGLSSEWQEIDVIITPIGSGDSSSKIGLQTLNNRVALRKSKTSRTVNALIQEKSRGKFSVQGSGKQCVRLAIEGVGKEFFVEPTKKFCMKVSGGPELKF